MNKIFLILSLLAISLNALKDSSENKIFRGEIQLYYSKNVNPDVPFSISAENANSTVSDKVSGEFDLEFYFEDGKYAGRPVVITIERPGYRLWPEGRPYDEKYKTTVKISSDQSDREPITVITEEDYKKDIVPRLSSIDNGIKKYSQEIASAMQKLNDSNITNEERSNLAAEISAKRQEKTWYENNRTNLVEWLMRVETNTPQLPSSVQKAFQAFQDDEFREVYRIIQNSDNKAFLN